MPNRTTNRARVMLPFGEHTIQRKYNYEEDADFNHRLCSARPEYLLQILRM